MSYGEQPVRWHFHAFVGVVLTSVVLVATPIANWQKLLVVGLAGVALLIIAALDKRRRSRGERQ